MSRIDASPGAFDTTVLAPSLEDELAPLSSDVDRVLAVMPQDLVEARRLVTRELGFEPGAGLLPTLIEIAHEVPAQGKIRGLARRVLSLRMLAEAELRNLLEGDRLEATRLDAGAARARRAVEAVADLRGEITAAVDRATDGDAELLRQLDRDLAAALDALTFTRLLAPRLATFAWSSSEQALLTAVPTLTEQDLAALAAATGRGPADGRPHSRAYLNALALRTILEDDLEAVTGADEVDAPSVSDQDLERNGVAYEFVTEKLRACRSMAHSAGLPHFTDELDRGLQMLHFAWSELQSALDRRQRRSGD